MLPHFYSHHVYETFEIWHFLLFSCSSAPSPAAPVKVTEDHSWPNSLHKTEASATTATPERSQTSVLTTSSPTTSPTTHASIISAVHSAPFIVPYPSEDHSFIGVLLFVLDICWLRNFRFQHLCNFLMTVVTFFSSVFGCVSHGGLSGHGPDRSMLGQVRFHTHLCLQKGPA